MKLYIWMTKKNFSKEEWKRAFSKIREAGISSVFLQGDVEQMAEVSEIAAAFDLELHSWIITMLCNDKSVYSMHPDWYAVNGLGQNSSDYPQYVNYYKWFCPSNRDVFAYLEKKIEDYCSIDALAGIHFDYIRFCDVILPIGIQPDYNLIQTREEPQFDYCYCEHCRKKFHAESGIDVSKLAEPSKNMKWRNFRYRLITNIVNKLTKIIHRHKQLSTAAVFPTVAKGYVRQEWEKWLVDGLFPMIYHSFYDQPLDWIKTETEQGKELLKNTLLNSGIFIPNIKPEDLQSAINFALEGGADGISIFHYNSMTEEHWNVFKKNNS